jgi:uncharacterized repeat protein (TIGR03803 family)
MPRSARAQATALAALTLALTAATASAATFNTIYTFTGGADGSVPWATQVPIGGALFGTTNYGGLTGHGTLFTVDPTTGTESVVYSFGGGQDGGLPTGQLAVQGNSLFGTAYVDGGEGSGTVFSITTAGAFTLQHEFTGAPDGASPYGGLVFDGANAYGETNYGGANGAGCIFELNPVTHTEKVIYSFTGGNDGGNPGAAPILKGPYLYGTTENGGTGGAGAVYKINAKTGKETTLLSFSSVNDGAQPSSGLVVGGSALYGAARGGGKFGAGYIYKIAPATGALTDMYDFTGAADGGYPEGGLVFAPHTTDRADPAATGGILYGTTPAGGDITNCAGQGCGTIFAISLPTGKETVLHAFEAGADGMRPRGALLLSSGVLYGTTAGGETDTGTTLYGTVFDIIP